MLKFVLLLGRFVFNCVDASTVASLIVVLFLSPLLLLYYYFSSDSYISVLKSSHMEGFKQLKFFFWFTKLFGSIGKYFTKVFIYSMLKYFVGLLSFQLFIFFYDFFPYMSLLHFCIPLIVRSSFWPQWFTEFNVGTDRKITLG